MAENPFFSSLKKDALDRLKEMNPIAQFSSFANESVLGIRKRQRMYFTDLKDVFLGSTTVQSQEINVNTLPDVELYIDPNNIGINKKVMVQKRLSKGGWVLQFWGHDLSTISVKGISGFFGMTYGMTSTEILGMNISGGAFTSGGSKRNLPDPLKIFNKLKDNCYMKRFDNNIPYAGFPLITLVFQGNAYRGFFENFNYSLTADKPFVIDYSFNFTIIPPDSEFSMKDIFGDLMSKQTAQSLLPSLIQDPGGAITRAGSATLSKIQKSAESQLDNLTRKIGFPDMIDITPSKMTLY